MATFLRQRATIGPSGGPIALMTWYWDSTGAAQAALCTEAMARVRAMFSSAAGFVPSSVTLVLNPLFDEIEETTGALVGQVAGTPPSAVTFTGATDAMPYQTQGLVQYGTNAFIDGRRVKGRQYIPFPMEGANDVLGVPTSGYKTGWQTAVNLLGTTVVTPMTQRIWHRPKAGSGGLSTPVITRTTGSTCAVLKSRRT